MSHRALRWAAVLVPLALSPSRAPALFGLGSEGPRAALLWIPPETFSDWDALERLLKDYESLKLTMALSPPMVSSETARRLLPRIAEGRLEVALRIPGDPILPLIAAHPKAPRPQDTLNRLALEREQHKLLFGSPPAGFSPGAGAVSPALFPAFKAMGLSWVASGNYLAVSSSWAAVSGVALAPLRAIAAPERDPLLEDLLPPEAQGPILRVIDEAGRMVPRGFALKLLSLTAERKPKVCWATLSEAVSERRPEIVEGAGPWPSWAGIVEPGSDTPDARRAWRLYGLAATTLDRYQNSGAADLKSLESATEDLYAAQSGRYYRWDLPAEEARAQDREFRTRLISVFRKLEQAPPGVLFVSVLGRRAGGPSQEDGEAVSTDILARNGPSWVSFENPSGSLSLAPAQAAPLPDGAPPDQLWRIVALRVGWDEREVTFLYRMARLGGQDADPGTALGPLLLETYMDLNGVVGAGSSALLASPEAFIHARDAWEYALSISGSGAFLYRSRSGGSPVLAGRPELSIDIPKSEIRLSLPRSWLRGNPLRWGYIVAAMVLDPSGAAKPPPKPLALPQGHPLLGVLAPLDRQRSLLERPEPGRQRLVAVRLPRYDVKD